MSRILDYVLEPNVVYTGDGFFIRVKVQDDYKYKKYLVSENMKYTTATGTTFTLTNAVSTNNASILQFEGNTTQNGTPTPTSPIEVQTVSGDSSVYVVGKNIIPTNVSAWENGQYDTSGNKTTNSTRMRLINLLPVKPSTTYKNGAFKGLIVRAFKKDRTFSRSIGIVNTSATLTTNADEYFLAITIDGTVENYVENTTKVMMTLNDITTTEWEAYTSNSYRVDLGGKNIFNKENDLTSITTANNSGATTVKTTDKITVTTGSDANSGFYITRANFITYINNFSSTDTYYISMDIKASRNITVTMGCDTRPNFNITTNTSRIYIATKIASNGFVLYSQSQTANDTIEITNIMISTSSDILYSPYVSNPIELCKIGSYVDSIKKSTGKNIFNNSVERKSAFPSTTVGNTVSYNNSSATYSYVNCCYINANTDYKLSWVQSGTQASGNARLGVIVDSDNKVLEQVYTWGSNASPITIRTTNSGYLVLATDINATNIMIEERKSSYNLRTLW